MGDGNEAQIEVLMAELKREREERAREKEEREEERKREREERQREKEEREEERMREREERQKEKEEREEERMREKEEKKKREKKKERKRREKEEREEERREEREERQKEREERQRERAEREEERKLEREKREMERVEREEEKRREREGKEGGEVDRGWVDERRRGRLREGAKAEERDLSDMSEEGDNYVIGAGSKLGTSFLGDATSAVIQRVMAETVTKTEPTKLHRVMKVGDLLKWMRAVNQLCEGDTDSYRKLVFSKATGEKAFSVRDELQKQPDAEDPVRAVLRGVFGIEWQDVLRKEWKEMAGRKEGKELWSEVVMVGGILGESVEQQRRKFLDAVPESVRKALVTKYLGVEEVLKVAWESQVLVEVEFLWTAGAPVLPVPAPSARPQGPVPSQPPVSFQPPPPFQPFGQFYPHGPYQPHGLFQQWRGGQGAFRGNTRGNPNNAGNHGSPAARGAAGGNQGAPAAGGAIEGNQGASTTGGSNAGNPEASGGRQCSICESRQHLAENCILNPQCRGYRPNVICYSCRIRGHTANMCNDVFRNLNKDGDFQYLVRVCEMSAEKGQCGNRIHLPLEVGDLPAEVLYDTGADKSHCDVKWAGRHGVKWKKRGGAAVTQSGKEVAIRGEAVVRFKYAGRTYMQKWLVLAGDRNFAAISEEDGRKLGIYVTGIAPVHSGVGSGVVDDREWLEEGESGSGLEVRLSEEQLKVIDEIVGGPLAENAKLPDKSVCNDRSLVYSFDVPSGTVVYKSQYHQTEEVKRKIHVRIMEWVAKGFCRKARAGNLNNLPVLLVAKVDGGKVNLEDYRVCLDARPLNEKNNSKRFSLPRIADIIKKATKATMMADLDLQNAFHQVLLDEVSSELSAFTDPWTGEHYQMSKMWFGESGSATQMQKVVHSVLGIGDEGTEDWRAYVDNMLVLYEGDDVREFAHQVRKIVEKLTAKGLKLKQSKCKVGYSRMRILGHLCEKGAARIDPVKVECFSKMERPRSLQAVRSILGFLNYVRDYVPMIADLLGPFRVLAKRRKWDDAMWTPKMDELFKTVGKVLESAPVLSDPDFGVPFVVATDASQYGVGAVLYQVVEGKKRFIGFGAKALQKGQKNYPAPKRELLAMLFGLRRWGEMLQPQEFTVEVDHKALVHLRSERSFMARDWMNYVAGFNFRVKHCPGLKHVLPHHLSHLYGILPGGEREKREEVFEEERKESEERKREEKEERARKRRERGEKGEGSEERVEVAEMTTRARVREQASEGSSKKRRKREERRKNQKKKRKERGKEGQTKEVGKKGKEGGDEGKEEETREEERREGEEEERRQKEEEEVRNEEEEGEGEVEAEEVEKGEEEEKRKEEEEGVEKEEGGGEGGVGEGKEGEEEEGGVGEVEDGGEEGEEEEVGGRGGVDIGIKEVGVQHLRVSDVPTKDLRAMERQFAEEVMEAKWVEKEQDKQRLLTEVHGKAHEGEGKLFMRLLAAGWFWRDMKRDCRREAAGCRPCLQYNVGKKAFHLLRSRGVVYPMQACHADHLVGLERAGPGGQYQDVLVVLDSASRIVWLKAVRTLTTDETKRKMEKIFRFVGWPGTLVTDGGPAFKSEEFAEWLEKHDVDHEESTPGAHEHNAAAERWMREIRAVLNKRLDMNRDGWWEELQEVQEALNTRWVKPLGSTPFELFFARAPEMRRVSEEERDEEVKENAEILKKRGEVMREEVLPVIAKKAKEVRQKHCDKQSAKRREAKTFKVGQLVMLDKNRETKQDPFYEGPFRVKSFSEKTGEYQLTRFGEDEVRVRTRHEHLKKVLVWKELDQEDRYVVTRVEGMREVNGERQYQVKWKGHRERTWEREQNLVGAEDRVRAFWKKKRKEERKEKEEGR